MVSATATDVDCSILAGMTPTVVTLDAIRSAMRLAGFAWSDAERDALRPGLERAPGSLRELDAARAAEADLVAGRVQGPLLGVPLGLKDLFNAAGVRTTGGSKILADSVPTADATVVRRLRAAGAIVLGKLNMHEFAYGPE